MRVYWLPSDGSERVSCKVPFANASHVEPVNAYCLCGVQYAKLQGKNPRPSEDDRALESDAVAACCGNVVGKLRVETGTLFGITEDLRVFRGQWRVF